MLQKPSFRNTDFMPSRRRSARTIGRRARFAAPLPRISLLRELSTDLAVNSALRPTYKALCAQRLEVLVQIAPQKCSKTRPQAAPVHIQLVQDGLTEMKFVVYSGLYYRHWPSICLHSRLNELPVCPIGGPITGIESIMQPINPQSRKLVSGSTVPIARTVIALNAFRLGDMIVSSDRLFIAWPVTVQTEDDTPQDYPFSLYECDVAHTSKGCRRDPPARSGGRHRDEDRQPHVSGDGASRPISRMAAP